MIGFEVGRRVGGFLGRGVGFSGVLGIGVVFMFILFCTFMGIRVGRNRVGVFSSKWGDGGVYIFYRG